MHFSKLFQVLLKRSNQKNLSGSFIEGIKKQKVLHYILKLPIEFYIGEFRNITLLKIDLKKKD